MHFKTLVLWSFRCLNFTKSDLFIFLEYLPAHQSTSSPNIKGPRSIDPLNLIFFVLLRRKSGSFCHVSSHDTQIFLVPNNRNPSSTASCQGGIYRAFEIQIWAGIFIPKLVKTTNSRGHKDKKNTMGIT